MSVHAAGAVVSLAAVSATRIAVFASGAGTTAEALMVACESGRLPARVALLVGNNSRAEVFARASAFSVPSCHISSVTHPDDQTRDEFILAVLVQHDVTHVVLAGYTKRLGPATLTAFSGRVFNTHPALLPAFAGQGMYGERVHAAVLASGVATTGATVHLVTTEYDEGPVIAQVEVPVRPGDDVIQLARRVQEAERTLLIEALSDRLR
jgi:phosphoribosylglycinamide formyltransferase 1